MIKSVSCFLLFLVLQPFAWGQVSEEIIHVVRQLTENLPKKEFAKVVEHFDETVAKKLPADQLAIVWSQLQGQVGAHTGWGEMVSTKEQGYDIIYVPCRFERLSLDMKVVFDKKSKVAGLFFLPSKKSISKKEEEPEYKDPGYAKLDALVEEKIEVRTGKYVLPGELVMPKTGKKFPAVILVHGSGPNDRDETVGPNKPFRDLALGLASNGVAVIRYNKRTLVYANDMAEMENITVKEETVDDALSAIHLAKSKKQIDRKRIFVLGHSLGGMLAPKIAHQSRSLAGIILLAANARPLEDLITEQIKYILSLDQLSKEDLEQLAWVKLQMNTVKSPDLSLKTPASVLPLGVPASYWLDLRNYDQKEMAQNLSLPMLVLQGEKDYQVTMIDFNIWKKVLSERSSVKFISYPLLNHLFMEGEGTPLDYEKGGTVPEYVINDIVDWINGID